MSQNLMELIAEKFTSGNNIEVERITITRAEYEAALAEPMNKGVLHQLYMAYCSVRDRIKG